MKFRLMIVIAGCTGFGVVSAQDLAGVYDKSLTVDPTLQQAESQYRANGETKLQALLNMLPINATANKSESGVLGNNGYTTTSPSTATVGLSVNLFSWNSWINLKAANITNAQGEAIYLASQQDLVSRVTQRYFAVLSARDQLAVLELALESASRTLEQAERRFEVGLIANTDVQIARAARDSSAADVIAGRRAVSSAEELLRAITGEKYPRLAGPKPDMPLLSPEPASEDAWVSLAMKQNATLVASRLGAENSHNQYLSALGGHIPSISVGAQRNWLIGGNNTTTNTASGPGTNTQDVTWTAGVSVPLFTAGLTQSKVRVARYNEDAARAGYDRTQRQTEQQTRDAYQGVISQIAQVQALQQAVESNRISLAATEAGYEVGTKTALDVLTSRQNFISAQSRYSQAKYGYLNNIVALRLAAGNLDVETVKLINGWLSEDSTTVTGIAPVVTAPAAPPAP
jgi:outer membrane protein